MRDQEPKEKELQPGAASDENAPAFRRFGDDEDGPLVTGPSRMMRVMVWIFGIGGGLAFAFTGLPGGCPGGSSRAPDRGQEEAEFGETRQALAMLGGEVLTLQIAEPGLDNAGADDALQRASAAANEVLALLSAEHPQGISLLAAAPLAQEVQPARALRDALQAQADIERAFGGRTLWQHPRRADAPAAPQRVAQEGGEGDAEEGGAVQEVGGADAGVEEEAAPPSEELGAEGAEAPAAGLSQATGPVFALERSGVRRLREDVDLSLDALLRARAFDALVISLLEQGRRNFVLRWGELRYASGTLGGGAWIIPVDLGASAPLRLAMAGRFLVERPVQQAGGEARHVVVIAGRADWAVSAAALAQQLPVAEAVEGLMRAPSVEGALLTREGRLRATHGFEPMVLRD